MHDETTLQTDGPSRGDARLRLVIVGADFVKTLDLGSGERVRLGRGEDNDVILDDTRLSRRHAEIERDPLRITDLESANGTTVGGRRIRPGTPTAFTPGVPVDLGGGVMLLAQLVDSPRVRTLSTHSYFEARLDDEARRRSRDRRTPFTVLFVRLEGEDIDAEGTSRALTGPLGPMDAVARFAPDEYEILLLDAAPARGEAVADRLREDFAALGGTARVGLACFPTDGLTGQALIATARASLHGEIGPGASAVVVADPAMKALHDMVERIARGTITVLVTGETGAGKEILAEAVHAASPRRAGPLVRLNCAALTEALVESELFGHVKGAFTGAVRDKQGLLEAGGGGTVFLDEIGELPATTQAKLLRVLETGRVRRLGGIDEQAVDVRFVAATNKDLLVEVERGTFREDLYYRLSGVVLDVPPLRERPGDLEPLVRMFVERFADDLATAPPEIDAEALALLQRYSWPGNIRELRNTLERAVLLADERITVAHLPTEKMTAAWSERGPSRGRPRRALGPEGEATRRRIEAALEDCAGNQTRAAQQLGISRQTLANWLDRYDIPRPRRRRS